MMRGLILLKKEKAHFYREGEKQTRKKQDENKRTSKCKTKHRTKVVDCQRKIRYAFQNTILMANSQPKLYNYCENIFPLNSTHTLYNR